jgi:hypothetical protein
MLFSQLLEINTRANAPFVGLVVIAQELVETGRLEG